MTPYVQCACDAAAQRHEVPSTTCPTSATQEKKSSKCSDSSGGRLSQGNMPPGEGEGQQVAESKSTSWLPKEKGAPGATSAKGY